MLLFLAQVAIICLGEETKTENGGLFCTHPLLFLGFVSPHLLTDYIKGTLSDKLIQNYRDDPDFQVLIDIVQMVLSVIFS